VKHLPIGQRVSVIACFLIGHRPRFRSDGVRLRWACERCSGASGERLRASAAGARRHARALNRTDRDDVGRRPLLSLLPLRLLRGMRRGE
jgi:hypothetical protein